MLRRCSLLSLFCVLLLAAACTTARRSDTPLRAPAPVKSAPPPVPAVETALKLGAGEFAVLVDSDPVGGIVVLNGVPVGRTPRRLVLKGTVRGFCREDVSIKVRFVAADTDHTSQTVEELLTPLDRIPANVHFTRSGASRVAR